MKNKYLEKFDSIIKIKITGININNYLKRLIKRKINIIKLIPISNKEVHLILKYQDYKKITNYKSTYKIEIIKTYGKIKLKETIKKNYILLIFITLSIIILIILSNIIFKIEIIHSDSEIRTLLEEELKKYNIKKFTFKKTYNELEIIEDKILENNKNSLEWIEIEEYGTTYIVRVEERVLTEEKETYQYQSIISTKSAIITQITAEEGEIVKSINDYVKKGDTIISGYITHPDNTKTPTMAKGTVYGEVWYTINIEYPYAYQEEILTGKNKTTYIFNFINKRLSLFDFNKYKTFTRKTKTIVSNNLLNISITKEKQYELKIIDEIYTQEEVINKAIEYAKNHLTKENAKIQTIKEIKILTQTETPSHISLKLFVKAIEEIGTISIIAPE